MNRRTGMTRSSLALMQEVLDDHWTWLKDPVRDHWARLDEDDLEEISGDHERLLDHVQVAYGIHRDQAELELADFMDEYYDYFELVRERSPSTPISPRPHH